MKKRKKFSKKDILLWLSIADLLMIFVVSISLAYFTSFDEVTNRLYGKSMEIALYEYNYNRLTETQKSTLIPNKLLPKDPNVQNTNESDVYVFLKVTVPVKQLSDIGDTGKSRSAEHRQELFYLKTAEQSQVDVTSFHTKKDEEDRDYWIELSSYETGKDSQDEVRTYVFGYSVYLQAYETTETLFDYIQLKNIRQFEVSADEKLNVKVEAYGVLADAVEEFDKNAGNDKRVLDETKLSVIYGYINESQSSERNGG